MSFFSNAFQKHFVGFGSVRTSGDTSKLLPGELGLYDANTYQAIPVASANAKPYKMFRLVQGSMHTRDSIAPLVGGLKESVKSRPINPKYIEKFYRVDPSRPVNDVWTIGYNGVSTCLPITGECGAKYTIRVDVQGQAVLRTYNRNLYRYFTIETPCCDDCDVTCDPATADPYLMAKELVEKINADVELKNFVKAELILETPISDSNQVTFDKFILEVLDEGTPAALTAVASQYSTYDIVRESRSGITSTYSVIVADGVTPSSYTPTAKRLNADLCGDCPAGWTAGSTMELEIRRNIETDDDGNGVDNISVEDAVAALMASQSTSGSIAYDYKVAALATLQALGSGTAGANIATGDLTVTPRLISVENKVVTVSLNITLVDATPSTSTFTPTLSNLVVATVVALVASNNTELADEYTAGEVTSICVPPAGTTTAWVADGSVYKTKRQLCATFAKECGSSSSKLTEIQAYFTNNTDITTIALESGSTNCAEVISLYQYSSNYYEIGCLEKPIPTFGTVPSYDGITFEECDCPPATSPYSSGAVGIRLTAAYEDTKFGTCSFNPLDHYNMQPLKLTVEKVDDAELCTDQHTKWSVTHLTQGKQASGLGETVLRDYLQFMGGYKGERFNLDPRWREVLDQEHLNVIDKNKYYKTYYLIHSIPNSHLLGMNVTNYDEKYVNIIHFAEDVDTSTFENLLASYTQLNDVDLEVL